jgi:large subunit ribosomal protein L21
MEFAVIKTGGKQYIVRAGDILEIEKLAHTDPKIVFDHVLLIADESKAVIGQPLVPGAKVAATVLEDGLGKKKMVFRYKAKVRSKKKKGHRQPYTRVRIDTIIAK